MKSDLPKFAMSDFVRRQTRKSRFSHFEGTDAKLLSLVEEFFPNAQPGYREGVLLVPVPVRKGDFFSGIVQLNAGDRLEGSFEARAEGEEPRKVVSAVSGQKIPALSVELVLYSKQALTEDPNHVPRGEWEVVSINASATYESTPITPQALLYNHFEQSGGTATRYTPEEFEAALKKSFLFWKDKVMLG